MIVNNNNNHRNNNNSNNNNNNKGECSDYKKGNNTSFTPITNTKHYILTKVMYAIIYTAYSISNGNT